MDAFPDLHSTIEDIVAEGEKVAVRWAMAGTHKGVHRGIPPTNRRMTAWGIHIYRFSGAKITEIWERFDTLRTVQQLGEVPKLRKG
jgi:predicted ester cyclase